MQGFYLDEVDERRRRYCLICHTFKPERCHHCSTCNKCILNMDHHCPWLNGCIGFFNRKFFMMLLMYAWLFAALTVSGSIPHFIYICKNFDFDSWKPKPGLQPLRDIMFLGLFGMCCAFLYIITSFYSFHV